MRGLVQDLLVLVSNKESLRDEGIWIAHRAAGQGGQVRKEIQEKWPEMFHGRDEWREVETKVHLQCYDEACHILPVFSITRIAQACYASVSYGHLSSSSSGKRRALMFVNVNVDRYFLSSCF